MKESIAFALPTMSLSHRCQ